MSEQNKDPKVEPTQESGSELSTEELEGVSGGVTTSSPVESTDDVKVRVR